MPGAGEFSGVQGRTQGPSILREQSKLSSPFNPLLQEPATPVNLLSWSPQKSAKQDPEMFQYIFLLEAGSVKKCNFVR